MWGGGRQLKKLPKNLLRKRYPGKKIYGGLGEVGRQKKAENKKGGEIMGDSKAPKTNGKTNQNHEKKKELARKLRF